MIVLQRQQVRAEDSHELEEPPGSSNKEGWDPQAPPTKRVGKDLDDDEEDDELMTGLRSRSCKKC